MITKKARKILCLVLNGNSEIDKPARMRKPGGVHAATLFASTSPVQYSTSYKSTLSAITANSTARNFFNS